MCVQVCVPYVHTCTHTAHIQDVCTQYTHTHAHKAHTPMHTYVNVHGRKFCPVWSESDEPIILQYGMPIATVSPIKDVIKQCSNEKLVGNFKNQTPTRNQHINRKYVQTLNVLNKNINAYNNDNTQSNSIKDTRNSYANDARHCYANDARHSYANNTHPTSGNRHSEQA